MTKLLIGVGAMLVAGVQSIFALTTQEIVALAKPAIVYIKAWNYYTSNYVSTGTGFFIARNIIITDCHVLSGDGKIQPGYHHCNGSIRKQD